MLKKRRGTMLNCPASPRTFPVSGTLAGGLLRTAVCRKHGNKVDSSIKTVISVRAFFQGTYPEREMEICV